jgi:penicillin-binding protein 2
MFYLEILSNQHYQKLSDKNRIHSHLMIPSRGGITDQKGKMLATNHNVYRAVILRDEVKDWRACLQRVQKLLNFSDEDVSKLASTIQRRPKFMPVALKENLTWEDVTTLELNQPDLPGIFIEEGRNRFYPHPHETAHFLGYVATPSEKDLDGNPLLAMPGYKIGKLGMEKHLEERLRGTPGVKDVEVNAHRKVVRELSSSNSIPGENVSLYIDLDLQQTLYQRLLQEESGAAVVLDIQTGGVLAYVSTPSFDNNLFVNGIGSKDWKELLDHPRHALINKPISGLYSPGSTFKMVVALAGLERGIINEQTSVQCRGHLSLGKHLFHCWSWKSGGHGHVGLERAIACSCDIYFYHIGSLIGIDAIAEMARRLGLGDVTGIEIPGEKAGLIPTRDWKSRVFGKGWSLGETYNVSIGQGYVTSTPLQLAVMIARLASNRAIYPRLCKGENLGGGIPEFLSLGLSSKHHQHILNGLNRAANEPGGTSYKHRIAQAGFEMAGKTGTTQVKRITLRERELGLVNHANRPWHHREHALFVGYAPVHNPRFAASVLIEHGGSGGRVAAPVGKDVLWAAQQILV